jgi:glycosyltransferase involved in cell wall biosynthesis
VEDQERIAVSEPISVIVTVKNEERSIRELLDSLAAQTRLPDELVLVDGGSSDGTVSTVEGYRETSPFPINVIIEDGANISRGRNLAVAAAAHGLIASTDAGVRLSPNWLAGLAAPLEEGRADVVSGFFIADPRNPFEAAMGATVLPALTDIEPREFLPSSRSIAFRKEAWAAAGGYPEWLDYCEDLIFDFALRKRGLRFEFAHNAVAHFRPRSSLRAFFRQYYRYARGDGRASLWPRRHAIRYATYLVALPGAVAMAAAWHPLWGLLLPLGAAAYLRDPYRRLRAFLTPYGFLDRLKAVLWVPVIRVTGDVAKMVGYPVGVRWRMVRRHGAS